MGGTQIGQHYQTEVGIATWFTITDPVTGITAEVGPAGTRISVDGSSGATSASNTETLLEHCKAEIENLKKQEK